MTCVIAWTNGKETTMASDSALTMGDQIKTMKHAKFHIFSSPTNPDLMIGYAGRAKAGQVLLDLHAVKLPEDNTPDPYIFVSLVIAPILQEVLGNYFLTIETETGEMFAESLFLVAYRGSLFTINHEFYVSETEEDFVAIGSGADYALGAMTALSEVFPDFEPDQLIIKGMSVAMKYSASVRGPVKIHTISATRTEPKQSPPKKKASQKKLSKKRCKK